MVLAALGTALVRGTGPYRSEYQGTVISKRITQQPGELDPLARRQLTLEQEDGSLLRVEVEERLYAVVEEGYFVHRSQQDGIEIRDPKGRLVALQKKARGNDGK